MIDLQVLKAKGIDSESLSRKLQGDPLGADPAKAIKAKEVPADAADIDRAAAASDKDKIQALLNRIRSRIQEGMARNFKDYRHYHALDQAWDTPFRQISPTLLSTLLDQNPNEDSVYKAFQEWGLTSLITEEPDPKDSGKKVRTLNLPVFFNVLVPLVKAYVTIRWAKIMNDRRLTPFFKFEPTKMTDELTLKCDIITDRIQLMSNQFGYYDVTKQAVLKMLHYSTCMQFVKEEWYAEEQTVKATAEDILLKKKAPDGTEAKEGDLVRVTDKEGLRYHLPHPTRTFWDMAHGAYTLNYDSGCEYAGYWRIARYREILDGNFWNKDKIALGTGDILSGNRLFFTTVYSACTLTIPTLQPPPPTPDGFAASASIGSGPGDLDREREIAQLYYGTEHGDRGVLVTEYFEKLNPKDNGLGDYDGKVWFRFLVAGDGCTILYAAPLPYTPVVYYGYDADESRSKNASMSLEVLPFQDQFSNMLTQIILTAKQNLANIVLLDEDQIEESIIDKLKGMGEKFFRRLNVIKFSGKKAAKFQNRVAEAAQSFAFPKGNVTEMMSVLKTVLDVLERVMVMSSNEVGQAASHEQTREEIRNIAENTSSRLVFTATPVDIARDAWKRQLYQGLMAYGDDDFYAHIPSDVPITKEALEQMGFTYVDKDKDKDKNRDSEKKTIFSKVRHVRVSVKKSATAIPLWELASTRDGEDRTNNEKVAASLAILFDKIMGNPITAAAVGADQALEWANRISYLAGLPRDFKLTNAAQQQGSPDEQNANAQDQLKQVVQAVLDQVDQKMMSDLQPMLDEVKNNSTDIGLIMKALKIAPSHPADEQQLNSNRAEAPVGSPS